MKREALANYLRKRLKEKKFTQKYLAEEADVSPSQISRIVNMGSDTTQETLISIARVLNDSPETLYRVAGLHPPVDIDQKDIDDIREIFKDLTREEIDEIKEIGWRKVDRKKLKSNIK